ncbi:hypothetical protein F7734_14820 [Scytonema sp. UIC 10036]|uniref:baeRF3 domain-containing protein n=1 Tax=Scytonema sp. UIC 10036 TaxID=2304196 RepID=UPI0012DA92A8|nr:hypothetical protein [Scytonema sp. UIC 10036]MUG93624.1 hypothetical protein [Scytonema sp. UIC 10036]
MSLLSIDEIKILLEQPQELCVSIFMPTFREAKPEMQQEPIRLKNLLREAEEKLIQSGMRFSKALKLLQPAQELLDERHFWLHQSHGLAIFGSTEIFRYYHLPLDFPELAIVGNRFHIKPLLPLLISDEQFYVLALSQKQVRLLQCTSNSVNEIELENVPKSIEEVFSYYESERQRQFRGATSTGIPGARAGVFHGQGVDTSYFKDDIRQFFHLIAHRLQKQLQDQKAPLVLAGVEYLLPIYKEVNRYAYLVDEGITGNPEELKAEELQAKAKAIVEPMFQQAQQDAIKRYRELAGTGLTSNDIKEILPAAYYQKVDCLFMTLGWEQWGNFAPDTNTVNLHTSVEPGDEDLLNLAATHALLNGSSVYTLDSVNMPDKASLAAIFRY